MMTKEQMLEGLNMAIQTNRYDFIGRDIIILPTELALELQKYLEKDAVYIS